MPVYRHPLTHLPPGTVLPTDPQVASVLKQSLTQFAPLGHKLTSTFYEALFAQYPMLRKMFPVDMQAQQQKLLDSLTFVVGALETPDKIFPQLDAMGRRHAQYGATKEHYDVVCSVLVSAMRAISLEYNLKWTHECESQWATALALISDRMLAAK